MKKFIEGIKFEWIFVTMLLLSLNVAMYVLEDVDIKLQIVMAMVSAFGVGIGYIFGRNKPEV